jgi:hypothetical protein
MTQITRSYSTPWAPILQSIQPKVFVKRGCSSDCIDYDMYNVGARPLKVRLRAISTEKSENFDALRRSGSQYSHQYVDSLYSVGEHHYITNLISCRDILGLRRAVMTRLTQVDPEFWSYCSIALAIESLPPSATLYKFIVEWYGHHWCYSESDRLKQLSFNTISDKDAWYNTAIAKAGESSYGQALRENVGSPRDRQEMQWKHQNFHAQIAAPMILCISISGLAHAGVRVWPS